MDGMPSCAQLHIDIARLCFLSTKGQRTSDIRTDLLHGEDSTGMQQKQGMQTKEAIRAEACDICVGLQNLVQAQASLVFC